jgi:molybdenum cofactor biosynthesis enzyme MoaA
MTDNLADEDFCPAPWTSLYIEPDGRIDNCCISRNFIGNMNNVTDVNEIIVGGKNKNIQQLFLQNELPVGCAMCKPSLGVTHQKNFLNLYPKPNNELYQEGKFELKYLDARWSNTCNLACVYCGPELSSTWAKELEIEKIDPTDTTKKTYKIASDKSNLLIDYVLDNVHTLTSVYLAGGEPLLMKENRLLIQAIKEKNSTCHILVNTNLTQIKNSTIVDDLLSLKNPVRWLISVDDTHERFEYLRYPAKWSEFEENFEFLKSKVNPPTDITLNMVFNSLNAITIWDTVDYMLAKTNLKGITLSLYVNHNNAGPWDPRQMPIEYQQQAMARMDRPHYKKLDGWQRIYDHLSENIHQQKIIMWDQLARIDRRRKLDSRKIFPEIYKYENYRSN